MVAKRIFLTYNKKYDIIIINKNERRKLVDNRLYNKDSIESLDPLQFTRLRPGVYARRYNIFNSIIGRNSF